MKYDMLTRHWASELQFVLAIFMRTLRRNPLPREKHFETHIKGLRGPDVLTILAQRGANFAGFNFKKRSDAARF